jgi:hypothetical protein
LKKALLTLLFLGLIPIACIDQRYPYFIIDSLNCQVYRDDGLTAGLSPTDSLSTTQSFYKINFSYNYISLIKNIEFFDFNNKAFAFSSEAPGFEGLKEKLSSIEIYSNKLFNGRPAKSNLKELFKWHDVQWDGMKKSIDSLVIALNKESFFIPDKHQYFLKLILNQRPTDSLSHIFTFDFVYKNGKHQTFNSTTINWKK